MFSKTLALGAAGVLMATAVAGCGIDRLDNFDVTLEASAVVEGASLVESVLDIFPPLDDFTRFDISQSQDFRNSNYGPEDVDSVILTHLGIEITDPDDQDFSFIRGIEVVLQTDGQPDLLVAWLDPIPETATVIELDLAPDDIQQYVMSNEGTFRVDVRDAKRPSSDTTLRFKAVFDVDVRLAL